MFCKRQAVGETGLHTCIKQTRIWRFRVAGWPDCSECSLFRAA